MTRSYLFVPANSERALAKAHVRGADALILDLEDSVAPDQKDQARETLAAQVTRLHGLGCQVYVRVNADLATMVDDLRALRQAPIQGLMIPKAQSAGQLRWISDSFALLRQDQIALIALIECPTGLMAAPEIAAVPKVSALALGPEDYCHAMGHPPNCEALTVPAQRLIWAARAAGKQAIACPDSIALVQDTDRFDAAVAKARALGSDGILCIHPKQVAHVSALFAPSAEQVAQAKRIVSHFEAAQKQGQGVILLDGAMIDLPVVERARAILKHPDLQKTPA